MVPVIFGRGQDSSVRVPRMNVVSVVILVASFTIGALASRALNNPVPVIVMAIVGIILMLCLAPWSYSTGRLCGCSKREVRARAPGFKVHCRQARVQSA